MRRGIPRTGGLLRRPRIDALIERGTEGRVLKIVAGPGYGKTCAVAAYVFDSPARVAWLDIVAQDNEPVHFWNSFICSLPEELRGLAADLGGMEFPSSPGGFSAFLEFLSEALKGDTRYLLVADNYTDVQNRQIAEFFERLVEQGPECLCIIPICNTREDIRLDRLTCGELPRWITTEDLRFTGEEIEEFFSMDGTKATFPELSEIAARTEGWPLAVFLAKAGYKSGRKTSVTGDSVFSYINELFESEYFGCYEPRVRESLLRLAKLPCFSFEIAAEIDSANAGAILEVLSSCIFVWQDYSTGLLRFHNAYLEFLRKKSFLISKEEADRVFLIAGEWFCENGFGRFAVDCFYLCREYGLMLEAIAEMPKENIGAETGRHILRLLEALPEDYKKKSPFTRFAAAFFYLNAMEVDVAREMFLSLERELESKECCASKALLGETCAMLATIDMIHNKGSAFVEKFKKASEYLPGGSRIQNRWIEAENNNSVFFLPDSEPGALERIVRLIFEGTAYAEKTLNCSAYGFEWLFAAEASYYSYDMEKARENAFRAIYKASERDQHDVVCNAHFLLLRIGVFYGDYAEAAGNLARIEKYVEERGLTQLHELRDCVASWFYVKMKDLRRVPLWISERFGSPYAPSPLKVGRDRIVRASYLMAKEDYLEALAAMEQTERIFSQKGLYSVRLTLYVTKAVCLLRLGRKEEAVEAFWAAYDLSWKNGIITPFVEFGNVMRAMLDNAQKSDRREFDPGWMEEVYSKSGTYAKRLSTIIGEYNRVNRIITNDWTELSAREKEVLDYLAKGMTRHEIGSFLELSVNSVKKYVSGIYSKLGAVNRADAVRIAVIRGLIE